MSTHPLPIGTELKTVDHPEWGTMNVLENDASYYVVRCWRTNGRLNGDKMLDRNEIDCGRVEVTR